jgi:nitric oxide reductase large subunit
MKSTIAAAAIAAGLFIAPAQAQERAVNTALGTAAGLIVFGPVGAVAGAAVGYTAGHGIASAWGLRRPPRKVRRTGDR